VRVLKMGFSKGNQEENRNKPNTTLTLNLTFSTSNAGENPSNFNLKTSKSKLLFVVLKKMLYLISSQMQAATAPAHSLVCVTSLRAYIKKIYGPNC